VGQRRSLLALAVTGALLFLQAPPVSAAGSVGHTGLFARVRTPGQPEGLAVRDGVVYVGTHTSMRGNGGSEPSRIFRYDLHSGRPVDEVRIEGQNLAEDHGLIGMTFGPDRRLYVADRNPPRLLALDFSVSPPIQTTYATFPNLPRCSSSPSPCAPSSNPGDALPDGLVFDAAGALYVSDVQKATIFRLPPGGGQAEIWFQDPRLDGLFGVNGIVIDPSHQRLVMAVTISNQPDTPGLGSIYSLPMAERPKPADLTLVHRYAEPFAAPDGITFGRSGRLYVALAGTNQMSILDGGTEVGRFPTAADNAGQEVPFDNPASPVLDGRGSLLVTNQSYVNGLPQSWAVLESWVDDTPVP
jgi:sugar lactone lactonase YvrE